MSSQQLMAVVPAYNEAANLARLIEELKKLRLDGYAASFVVIDDGSRDRTRAAALEAGARVVSHPYNMGIGMTVQTGFKYALERGADYVVQVDGDGQHIPDEIAKLVACMAEKT